MQIVDGGVANMAVIFHLILGLWGLFRAIRQSPMDGSYQGAIVIGWFVFVGTAVIDLLLFLNNMKPSDAGIHYLYTAFSLIFAPFVYFVLLKGDDSNRGQWVMAFAMMFMCGIAIRSIQTGI